MVRTVHSMQWARAGEPAGLVIGGWPLFLVFLSFVLYLLFLDWPLRVGPCKRKGLRPPLLGVSQVREVALRRVVCCVRCVSRSVVRVCVVPSAVACGIMSCCDVYSFTISFPSGGDVWLEASSYVRDTVPCTNSTVCGTAVQWSRTSSFKAPFDNRSTPLSVLLAKVLSNNFIPAKHFTLQHEGSVATCVVH